MSSARTEMRAVVCDDKGTMTSKRVTVPTCGDHEVLVRVHACSCNRVDCCRRTNMFNEKTLPSTDRNVGCEGCGVVEARGKNVTRIPEKAEVFFLSRKGCYSDYCVVDERFCAIRPKNMKVEECAALPFAGVSAWMAFNRCRTVDTTKRPEKDRTCVVVCDNGSMAFVVVALALRMGWKVIACCRPEMETTMKTLEGSDRLTCVNVRDWSKNVTTSVRVRADVVFCCVEEVNWDDVWEVCNPYANVCVVYPITERVDWAKMFNRGVTIVNANVFACTSCVPEPSKECYDEITNTFEEFRNWCDKTRMRPVVQMVDFDKVNECHRVMEKRSWWMEAPVGKWVVKCTDNRQ